VLAPRESHEASCAVCQSPTGDGAYLCRTHTAAITHALGLIPDQVEVIDREHLDSKAEPTGVRDWNKESATYGEIIGPILFDKVNPGLASELETTITRQDKLSVNSGAATSGEKPLNWNDRAANIEWELKATCNAWALETSKHREDPRDPLSALGIDLAPVAEWLIRNIHTLRLLPDAGDAYSELIDAIHRAESVIDRSAFATRFVVGPCPEVDGDEVHCPGEVWAFIPVSEEKPALMVCQNDECGAAWNTTQWMRAAARIKKRIEETKWQPTRPCDAA
jgi:hypothetical protein